MPNQYSKLVRRISVVIPEDLFRKVEVSAKNRKMSTAELIRHTLAESLCKLDLTDDDLLIVMDRIKAKIGNRTHDHYSG